MFLNRAKQSYSMVYFGCFRFTTVIIAAMFSDAGAKPPIIYAKSGDNVTFSLSKDQCGGLKRKNIYFTADGFQGRPAVLTPFPFPYAPGARPSETAVPYNNRLWFFIDSCCLVISLHNVSHNDAGTYELCDFTTFLFLAIVEAPVNASITVEGVLIDGHGVKLRCSATSQTRPHKYPKPMKFRWFFKRGLNDTQERWTEILGGHGKEFFEWNENDDDDDDETDGSGWGQAKFTEGHRHYESVHEVLEICPLGGKDDGRRIACSAMEDFNLWSDKSPELVLSLEWKPTHRDLALVPNVTHTTLAVGDSIDVICMATCRPECNVTWEKIISGNKMVTLTENSTLSLHNVSHHAHGVYRCRGSNVHGSAHVHWKLSVAKTNKNWLSEMSHVITVVAIVAVALVFGIPATAMAVLRHRKRRFFSTWSHQRLSSVSDSAPSLSDHKETANSSSADKNAIVSSL